MTDPDGPGCNFGVSGGSDKWRVGGLADFLGFVLAATLAQVRALPY